MKVRAFHGTTPDGARRLLSGKEPDSRVWQCSIPNELYIWCPHVAIELEEIDPEYQCPTQWGINQAIDSAQIAASIGDPVDTLVILEFEFDIGEIGHDLSCENMEHARCVSGLDYQAHLVAVHEADHCPYLSPLFIRFLKDNEHFDWDELTLRQPQLVEASEIMMGVEWYQDEPPEARQVYVGKYSN